MFEVDYILIPLVALLASCLTLFSGFGLGTLLMPVTALFFPLEVAITITAIVHLANNLFKLALFGKDVNLQVLWRFGLTAVIFAFVGASLLLWLGGLPELFRYQWLDRLFIVEPIKLLVGCLILFFVFYEFSSKFSSRAISPRYLPLGGILSGFFGGLTGNQGAFRSLFLLKCDLNKDQFIATGVVLAVIVDVSRLAVYGFELSTVNLDWLLISITCITAFLGAYFGKRLVQKVTIHSIQKLVATLLILVAIGLIFGWI